MHRSGWIYIFLLWFLTQGIPFPVSAEQQTAKGIIEAAQEAILSSEMAGRIAHIARQEGERFKKGDPLVKFICDLQRAEHQIAVIHSHAAKVKQEHLQRLDKLASAGKLEMALAQSALAETEARLMLSKAKTRRCIVRAPFSGIVITRHVNPHESVDIHTPLLHVIGKDHFEVVIIAPVRWLGWLSKGTPFTFQSPAQQKPIPGKIIRTGMAVDPSSQTVAIRGLLEQNKAILTPGMGGTVIFPNRPTP